MENIIIIGAGPAGISAALYAARGNMDPLIIIQGIGSLEKAEEDRELLRTGAAAVRQRAFRKRSCPGKSTWSTDPGCPGCGNGWF